MPRLPPRSAQAGVRVLSSARAGRVSWARPRVRSSRAACEQVASPAPCASRGPAALPPASCAVPPSVRAYPSRSSSVHSAMRPWRRLSSRWPCGRVPCARAPSSSSCAACSWPLPSGPTSSSEPPLRVRTSGWSQPCRYSSRRTCAHPSSWASRSPSFWSPSSPLPAPSFPSSGWTCRPSGRSFFLPWCLMPVSEPSSCRPTFRPFCPCWTPIGTSGWRTPSSSFSSQPSPRPKDAGPRPWVLLRLLDRHHRAERRCCGEAATAPWPGPWPCSPPDGWVPRRLVRRSGCNGRHPRPQKGRMVGTAPDYSEPRKASPRSLPPDLPMPARS